MGHFYNINSIDSKENYTVLADAKYRVPPMFYPLFSGTPTYIDDMICCDAKTGLSALKTLYNFLEKHRDVVFKNPLDFVKYKQRIIIFFEENQGEYYQLDGSDVYEMSLDESEYLSESQRIYELIQQTNFEIAQAINTNNIEAFLNITTHEEVSGEHTLQQFFDEFDYNYGYVFLDMHQATENEVPVIPFREQKKSGLKTEDGTIILPPTYDNIYNNFVDLLLTEHQGKYGYINKKGKIVVPFTYEYAEHFDEVTINNQKRTLAIAYTEKDQAGVINSKGKMVIPFEYEFLEFCKFSYYFEPYFICVKNDVCYFITTDNKIVFTASINDVYPNYRNDEPNQFLELEFNETNNRGWIALNEMFIYQVNKDNLETKNLVYQFTTPEKGLISLQNGNIVKNKLGKVGVITIENEVILPFQFDAIQYYHTLTEEQQTIYATKIGKKTTYYQVDNGTKKVEKLAKKPV